MAVNLDVACMSRPGIAAHPGLQRKFEAPALPQESHRLRIRRDEDGQPTQLGGHVGQGGAFVDGQARHRRPGELEDLAHAPTGLDLRQGQQVRHDIFGGHAFQLGRELGRSVTQEKDAPRREVQRAGVHAGTRACAAGWLTGKRSRANSLWRKLPGA